MTASLAIPWHAGEIKIHSLTHVGEQYNPLSTFLSPRNASQVQQSPLIAVGTLDSQSRPWTTLWGGNAPVAQAVAQSVLGIKADVDVSFDPVVECLFGGKSDGEIVRAEKGKEKLVSGVSISLEQRGRVKLFGRMIAGSLSADMPSQTGGDLPGKEKVVDEKDSKKLADYQDNSSAGRSGEVQMAMTVEQSIGNCPKYLNKKQITPAKANPYLLSTDTHLNQRALDLIEKADLFFISSSHEDEDMDTNHRGGPPGFIRVQQPQDKNEQSTLVWPEYSGNNLYFTLGNLLETPRAGLVIPDFDTGDVLYVTGETQVLIGADAADVIAKSSLAVKLQITGARLVQKGLAFRGRPIEDSGHGRSPYNPRVRYLASERKEEFAKQPGTSVEVTAQLVRKTKLTPTIMRYRFALSNPSAFGPWKPGQYVALDFSDEMDMGYSHMRDDDPTSLNDDYLRTFTVSSQPNTLGIHGEEFEMMIRNVGSITQWLSWQREGMTEIAVRGFGGDFKIEPNENRRIGFVAAGIGITPLLSQISSLHLDCFELWWSVGIKDVGLVADVLQQYPQLKSCVTVFVSGDVALLTNQTDQKKTEELMASDLRLIRRRISKDDLTAAQHRVDDWYICAAPLLRRQVQEWLPDKTFVYENFDY